jgi:hypothetical protein
LALLGVAWLFLALLEKKKIKKKKKKSYYPKIDVRSIVAYLVWAPYRSVWLLQGVTAPLASLSTLTCELP